MNDSQFKPEKWESTVFACISNNGNSSIYANTAVSFALIKINTQFAGTDEGTNGGKNRLKDVIREVVGEGISAWKRDLHENLKWLLLPGDLLATQLLVKYCVANVTDMGEPWPMILAAEKGIDSFQLKHRQYPLQ